MSKPVCVITGDVHFTPSTLALASAAVEQAIALAIELNVPLVLNGDTLDSKAIIRGECANRLIDLLSDGDVATFINTGNHDMISEKGTESSLNFLRPYADVVKAPVFLRELGSWMIPYVSDPYQLQGILDVMPDDARLIVHQGVQTAHLGHYVQDTSSLPPSAFSRFRVVGSHYHRRQTIVCGPTKKNSVGNFDYIGNPYSLSFAEAEDGPKGVQVLYDDGSLELVPTNLRKHIVTQRNVDALLNPVPDYVPGDLVWLKVSGPKTELDKINKNTLGKTLFGHANFKLTTIPTDTAEVKAPAANETDADIFDRLIDGGSDDAQTKIELKSLWKDLVE